MNNSMSMPRARWALLLGKSPCGEIELHEADAGFFFRWNNKPEHLVQLQGVVEASESAAKPFQFFNRDDALSHLMHCTGIAFRETCGLVPMNA